MRKEILEAIEQAKTMTEGDVERVFLTVVTKHDGWRTEPLHTVHPVRGTVVTQPWGGGHRRESELHQVRAVLVRPARTRKARQVYPEAL